MSSGLIDGLVECPKCGAKLSNATANVIRGATVKCKGCGCSIKLEDVGGYVKEVENVLEDFTKKLGF